MEVEERARHELYEDLKRVLGVDSADALMRYLPPVGWGDVATRRDLELLEARLDGRITAVRSEFEGLRADFEGLRADVSERLRSQTVTLVTTFVAVVTMLHLITAGIVVAVLTLT